MTISYKTLTHPAYRHIVCRASETVGEAIAALRAADGGVWWPIIIDYGDERYGMTRLQSLSRRAGLLSDSLPYRAPPVEEQIVALAQDDTPLGDIEPDAILDVVAHDAISEAEALERAAQAPGRMLAVTRAGELAGILIVRETRRYGFRRAQDSEDELGG